MQMITCIFNDICLFLACSGHTALDMDQPFCYLGVPGFLHVFQLLLGWNNMVRHVITVVDLLL